MASLDPLPYYKWLWRDWRSNRRVARMHYIARGFYRELLDEQWADGSIPNDIAELAEAVGCPRAVMELYWPEIEPCFQARSDGRLVNEKLERQRTNTDAMRIQKIDAGRAGGRRSTSTRQHPLAFAEAEQEHKQEQEQSKDPPPAEPPLQPPRIDPVRDAIERLFAYYCDAFALDPSSYSLTPMRREKAESRMRERMHQHLGDPAKAEMDLIRAIENLSMSEFHRQQGFTDWIDQIFRSRETFEKRLNWVAPKGDKHGRSSGNTKTGATIDALQQARAFTRSRVASGGDPGATS